MAAPHLHLLQTALSPAPAAAPQAFAVRLLQEGLITAQDMVAALERHSRDGGQLVDILLAQGRISEDNLYAALARHSQCDRIPIDTLPPDPRLIDQLGAGACLRDGVLPWRKIGAVTIIATSTPQNFQRLKPQLQALFGPVTLGLAPATMMETALLAARGPMLAQRAQSRVPNDESCRNWGLGNGATIAVLIGLITLIFAMIAPMALALALTFWAILTLGIATAIKAAATIAALRAPMPEPPPPSIARLPVVSVMVALYRESNIAARLVRRLDRLDYPRELLDILLVVEEEDTTTRAALRRANLPAWMRVIVVPDGKLKTKPRALNYALDACRGSIIGVYDAEDAPAPDQIRRVVDRFHARSGKVACLQGILDFYNPSTNWLSRCFTMEYSVWFRLILPGLVRMGFPIPLGGTTVFFRRSALESCGGWDAHNVTEDADLGIRLARHGFRTEWIDTTTDEEANCRALPWIKQRSRWLKGYMVTYAVHMRRPRLLLQQLGWWQFFGFQMLFLTTLSQFLLAPLLWSFWVVPFGMAHPVLTALPHWAYLTVLAVLLFTEAVLLTQTLVAMRLTPHRLNLLWAPTLHFYFPLGTLASFKAAWELIGKPFYWDKTSHGHFDPLKGVK